MKRKIKNKGWKNKECHKDKFSNYKNRREMILLIWTYCKNGTKEEDQEKIDREIKKIGGEKRKNKETDE